MSDTSAFAEAPKAFVGFDRKAYERLRHVNNPRREYRKKYREEHRLEKDIYYSGLKIEVLKHYGPGGTLQCSVFDCGVCDPDMLVLDHINDDGSTERKLLGYPNIYSRLRKMEYPVGYQTLCSNHNLKKELLRRIAWKELNRKKIL